MINSAPVHTERHPVAARQQWLSDFNNRVTLRWSGENNVQGAGLAINIENEQVHRTNHFEDRRRNPYGGFPAWWLDGEVECRFRAPRAPPSSLTSRQVLSWLTMVTRGDKNVDEKQVPSSSQVLLGRRLPCVYTYNIAVTVLTPHVLNPLEEQKVYPPDWRLFFLSTPHLGKECLGSARTWIQLPTREKSNLFLQPIPTALPNVMQQFQHISIGNFLLVLAIRFSTYRY